MGQQQLLLIVLGVIIVGIAVVVGINVFTASSAQANRDGVVSDLTNLASLAQTYNRKPASLGGGGNSFVGWTIPTALDSTGNGTYAASGHTADAVTIVGTGTEIGKNGTSVLVVTMVVGKNGITSTTMTN